MQITLSGQIRGVEKSEEFGTSLVVWDYETDCDVKLKISDEIKDHFESKDLIQIVGVVDTRLYKNISNFITLKEGKISKKGKQE